MGEPLSEPRYRGSNPCLPAKLKPIPHSGLRRPPHFGAGGLGGRFCRPFANHSTEGTGVANLGGFFWPSERRAAGADAARGLLVQPGQGHRWLQLLRVIGARRCRVAGGTPDRRPDNGRASRTRCN